MNNDLISRSALIDALPIVTKDRKVSLFGVVFDFVDMICNAPAVDAVEVVRCRECDLQSGCKVAQRLGSDGYCSYGERREDG